MIGRTASQETRRKISKALSGVRRSAESILKSSAARTGAKRTPEQVERIRLGQIGNKHAKKSKIKIGLSSKQRWSNPEYRAATIAKMIGSKKNK
jgi:hypothetical protein